MVWFNFPLRLANRQTMAVHQRSVRLLLQVSVLFVLGVAALCAYINLVYTQVVAASSPTPDIKPVTAKSQTVQTAPASSASPGAPTHGTAHSVRSTAASVPSCSPGSFQLPTRLSPPASGIQQIISPAAAYRVYGSTPAQIMAQIARCTPVRSSNGTAGPFAADTAYALTWHFNYASGNDGLCTLNGVGVGLHISQIFPSWQPSSANAGLQNNWATYISKLRTYENGHVQLDEAAAGAVFTDLQNFPPTDCGTIVTAATAKATADVHTYDTANANYDTSNAFGLKQDIILH